MNGASKILTVSYGTFSCTLEGFDEPFNTMKAIAEYFRDLAADDRYFGAEPPTPDATMLHRIAERAVNRRVEATIEDNTVILRTGDAMQAPSAPASATPSAPPSAPVPHAPLAAPRPAATGLLAEESVAAKLQRIRAAVARSSKPAEEAPYVEEEDAAPIFVAPVAFSAESEGDGAEEIMLPPKADWDTVDDEAGPEDLAGAQDRSALTAALFEDRDDPVTPPPEADVADTPVPVAAAPEAVALEDRMETEDDLPVRSSFFPEEQLDEGPEALPELTVDDLPESAVADEDAFIASTAPTTAAEDDIYEEEDAATSVAVLPPAWDEQALAEDSDPEASEVWDATSLPAAGKDAYAAFEDRSDLTGSDETWPVDPEMPEPADAAAEPTAASDKLRRARQRVLVVRAPETAGDGAGTAPDSPLAAQADSDSVGDGDATQKAEGRAILEDNAKEAEDVTRLLRQTNTEMDEPENRRRLSTMAHLKAAVAATVADLRSAGSGSRTGEATRLDRYRADLARVVRPRRPDGTTPDERPAPLVLVSEQRIDRPAPDGAINRVVPRRISTSNLAIEDTPHDSDAPAEADNIFAAARNFAEFAEHLGASDMPDLLEAAAAYTACMEGRPHFTRPHLMRHVAAASEQSDVNREDSMRSFGTLLRQGKIAKVKRGQFAITDSSYYLAEARRMTR